MPPIALALKIKDARSRLDDLWEAATDAGQRKKVVKEMNALDREIMRLISININKSGAEYRAATAALDAANAKLRAAIKDLQEFAQAMEAIASAIDLVARVKPV